MIPLFQSIALEAGDGGIGNTISISKKMVCHTILTRVVRRKD